MESNTIDQVSFKLEKMMTLVKKKKNKENTILIIYKLIK